MKKKSNQGVLPAAPYVVWSSLFIVIPLLIIIFFSFTIKTDTGYKFSLENYEKLMNPNYFSVFGRSLLLAFQSTIACLIIGYPVAYLIANMNSKKRNFLIMLFIVPMWMNFLLRTYAWLPLLGKNGFINTILANFGIGPLKLLYNDFAVLLGMVYNFLPFMILPIYTVLVKMDTDLINAASDLGATKSTIFRKIIFPLSMPGIISGITMVFMPAVSTFVISRILGGGQYMLLQSLVERQQIMVRKLESFIKKFYLILIFIFLYLPIVTLMVFSFNDSKSMGKWNGFTLNWYIELFQNDSIMSALKYTLLVAIISSIVATIIGTFAAIGINRMRGFSKKALLNINYLPVLSPDIVTGISLMSLFIFLSPYLKFEFGFTTLLLAHITFNIPYVILSILPKLKQLPANITEAALDLGATPAYAMRKIILPQIKPGIFAGFLMAFTMSIDDFVISFFTTGPGVNNLSIEIYSMARKGINPSINALSTLMFLTVLILLLIVNRKDFISRGEK